jgi:hypothetical protein
VGGVQEQTAEVAESVLTHWFFHRLRTLAKGRVPFRCKLPIQARRSRRFFDPCGKRQSKGEGEVLPALTVAPRAPDARGPIIATPTVRRAGLDGRRVGLGRGKIVGDRCIAVG